MIYKRDSFREILPFCDTTLYEVRDGDRQEEEEEGGGGCQVVVVKFLVQ